jgi:A/G-specific adenine glycosylase
MSENLPTLSSIPDVRADLRAWYRISARVLPWRTTPTPYRVWMSELMLQQTQVQTVVPYFERFMAAYPTVEDLAQAPEDEVLGLWAGLGYYRRARALHAGARIVTERGDFPETVEQLQTLPGVGRYTAGAIASIAFGVPAPVVDGNVSRVLSRLLALTACADKPPGLAHLWKVAEALVDPTDPSAHNQGLMELGARVCTPRAPACDVCPLGAHCAARAAGAPESFPHRSPRKKPRPIRAVAGVLLHPDRGVLLARRPEGGLLAGLWEVPGGEWPPRSRPESSLTRAWRTRLGVQVSPGDVLGEVEHVFTHRRLRLQIRAIEACDGEPTALGYPEIRWARPDELGGLPLSRLTQKVLETVGYGRV